MACPPFAVIGSIWKFNPKLLFIEQLLLGLSIWYQIFFYLQIENKKLKPRVKWAAQNFLATKLLKFSELWPVSYMAWSSEEFNCISTNRKTHLKVCEKISLHPEPEPHVSAVH